MLSAPQTWSPYESSTGDRWDLRKAAHLYRRAGFGATWEELRTAVEVGPVETVNRLLRPPAETQDERQILAGLRQGVIDSRSGDRLKAYWFYRILHGGDPLREKLTLFWHGHFATSDRKVQSSALMLRQNELFRRHALGSFGAMLSEMVFDPAMLIWLDGAGSKKEQPNENFAREFLELFTLGPGRYAETDIREAARAFTGWTQAGNRKTERDEFRLDPEQIDPGEKCFLGRRGPWRAEDIVRITLEQPATAEFLCRKLYRALVSETSEPAPELISPLAREFREHGNSVGHVIAIVLRSRHFYSTAAYRQRLRGPVEFSAGLLRALEVQRSDVRLLALAVACDRQGQNLFHPPNVKGWDGGKKWINSTTVLERGNWVADVIWGNPEFGIPPYDPLAWVRRHGIAPNRAAAAFAELLLAGDLNPKARTLVEQAGADGSADGLRRSLQLLLHCPEFQLT